MRAVWNGATLAQAEKDELIRIDGEWYFPPESITAEHFQHSDHHKTNKSIGEVNYYHISVNDQINPDAAWYYPQPKKDAKERVGKDFTDYVVFGDGIEVAE